MSWCSGWRGGGCDVVSKAEEGRWVREPGVPIEEGLA